MFVNPVLYGKNRRDKEQNKRSVEIFNSLNWTFISGCHEEPLEDLLIISCQGYTFELELIENGMDDEV